MFSKFLFFTLFAFDHCGIEQSLKLAGRCFAGVGDAMQILDPSTARPMSLLTRGRSAPEMQLLTRARSLPFLSASADQTLQTPWFRVPFGTDQVGRDNNWPGQPAASSVEPTLDWSEVAALARLGVRFASHSATHTRLDRLDGPTLHRALRSSRD